MNDDIGGVCIVTQPERGQTGKEHAADLAEIIAELTTVTVLTANLPSDARLHDEHDVIEFSSTGAGDHIFIEAIRFVLNQLRLCRELHRCDEAVVLFFGTTSYVLPMVISKLTGKTTMVLPRGDVPLSLRLRWEESLPSAVARLLAGLISLLERMNYRLSDGIITYTPQMARQLGLKRYGAKLYPNGARFVDTDQFDVTVPFDERDQVVGFIGRLDIEKRVPALAAAAQQLPADVQFVFVGDGNYREALVDTLDEEIDSGKVELVGWVDREEVPHQLNRLQLLVVPSHPTEGLPTAILESMACGTPALATPVSGVPDVVREGETGFHLTEISDERIARKVVDILERDDLSDISTSARDLMEAEYSFEQSVRRYEEILEQIVG